MIILSDGTPINHYWSTNKEKIIKELKENPKCQNGYELANIISLLYVEGRLFNISIEKA